MLAGGQWRERVATWTLSRHGSDGSLALAPMVEPALLELVWETVRLREFVHRPSRLDGLFLWADEGQARAWHYRQHVLPRLRDDPARGAPGLADDATAGLYEVAVVTCRRLFVADMNLISHFGDTVGGLLERARRYWRDGADASTGEVLLEGSVVVRRDLLARAAETLVPVADPPTAARVRAALRWNAAGGAADGGAAWRLRAAGAESTSGDEPVTAGREAPRAPSPGPS